MSAEENILICKTRKEWIRQAKEALEEAEKYSAYKIDDMRENEKNSLRLALDALGMNVNF